MGHAGGPLNTKLLHQAAEMRDQSKYDPYAKVRGDKPIRQRPSDG